VKSGKVGIIGASGTGTQELTVLLDSAGCGITHAIGTGGRDLSAEVAGRTAFAALELLAKDAPTEIIAIISKPPSKEVADRITEAVKKTGKPCVLAFLGASAAKISDRIFIAGTIEEAAAKIGALCKGNNPDSFNIIYDRKPFGYHGLDKFKPSQKAVRGLYTGGTLASEAQTVLAGAQAQVIDLGDDEYTKGALHPMIDPANRSSHIHEAYADDKVAVILCDVVLGYGSHNDPAGVLAKDVKSAKEKTNAHKIVIACVVGSDADPQGKAAQIKALEEAGIFVFPSNQYAAEIAAKLAKKLQGVE
jgi:FdrA protein